MTKLERFLDNIHTITKLIERATRRKRRIRIRREHILFVSDIGGTILSMLAGKYKAAGKAATVLKLVQSKVQTSKEHDDSDGHTDSKRSDGGEHRDRPVPLRPSES